MKTEVYDIVEFYNMFPEEIGNILVDTQYGYKEIEFADVTSFDSNILKITLSNGLFIEVSEDHLLFTEYGWKLSKNLILNDNIKTKFGYFPISKLEFLEEKEDLYDLQVDGKEYYANDIVSHNSSLIESICFALFNKPYRNINKPQLVNSVNGKNMVVELYFTIGDDKFIIKRGMKPTIFEIIKNGILINQDADSRDYQEYLESNIIKLRHKSFTQTSIMGTTSFVPFMQLSANNRRLFMEDLLDQQIFTTMNVVLKTKLNDIKVSLSELEVGIKILDEKINLHKDYIKKLNEDKNKQIDEIREKVKIYEKENIQYENEIHDIRTTINELEIKIKDIEKYKSKLAELGKYDAKLHNNKGRIEKELTFFERNDNCPTCHQSISPEFSSKIIEETKTNLNELLENERLLNIKIENYNKKLVNAYQIQVTINTHEKNINNLQALLHSNNKNINQLNNELTKLSEHNKISFSEGEISILENEYKNKIKEREEINSKKIVMDDLAILLKDNGIKAQIVKKYIPIINKCVNKYLEDMNFFINFNLDEQFNETIKSRHRDIFSYESFSEGEKMRLNLALVFTWRMIAKMRSSTTSNLLFFDEIMDSSLDYDGIDTFFKMVDSLGSETNVFIISHKTDMVDKFSNIIKVEKIKNFSKWVTQ